MGVAIDFLRGKKIDRRLREVVLRLGVEILLLAGKSQSAPEAERTMRAAISSGAAAERFARMVTAMGGPIDLLERPEKYLSRAVSVQAVYPPRRGYVAKIDTRSLGLCVVKLGGGRRAAADAKGSFMSVISARTQRRVVPDKGANSSNRAEADAGIDFRVRLHDPCARPRCHGSRGKYDHHRL